MSSDDQPNEIFGQAFSRPSSEQTTPVSSESKSEEGQAPLDPAERIRRLLRPVWIGYDAALAIREKLDRLLETPYSDRITSCAIIGPSLNGKTSLFRNLQRRHNVLPAGFRMDGPRHELKIPVFFAQCPPEPDEDRLLDAILRRLHLLGSPREGREHKIARIQAVFSGLGVKLLELDEFGFFQAGSADRQRKALNGLKYLSNELKIPIVVCSVEEGLNILSANPELANRFPAVFLPRWSVDDGGTLRMLASFEKRLGLRQPSNLGTPELARPIVTYSEGVLGHMHDLLRRLAERAIRDGTEQITKQDLTPQSLANMGWVLPSQRHQRPA